MDENAKKEAIAEYEKKKTQYEKGEVPGQDPAHMEKSAQYVGQQNYRKASVEERANQQFFPWLDIE